MSVLSLRCTCLLMGLGLLVVPLEAGAQTADAAVHSSETSLESDQATPVRTRRRRRRAVDDDDRPADDDRTVDDDYENDDEYEDEDRPRRRRDAVQVEDEDKFGPLQCCLLSFCFPGLAPLWVVLMILVDADAPSMKPEVYPPPPNRQRQRERERETRTAVLY